MSVSMLIKRARNVAKGTHLFIAEYETWDDYINFQEAQDEAARTLFGRSYPEIEAAELVYALTDEDLKRAGEGSLSNGI